eukprot:8970420-Pyramimonas_sp.AAC.1
MIINAGSGVDRRVASGGAGIKEMKAGACTDIGKCASCVSGVAWGRGQRILARRTRTDSKRAEKRKHDDDE